MAPSLAEEHSPQPGFHSLEQAASWYATLCSESATETEHRAWRDWLAKSPENVRAWSYIETVSRRFGPLRGSGHEAAVAGIKAARRATVGRRQVLAGLAGVLGLGIASALGWRHTALPELVMAWGADYRTAIGEQQHLTLADGSQVWLNTNSALSVDYQANVRVLKLITGEILVQTAHNQDARPFYVETRFGRMQALGTRFSVNHDDSRTRLDVFKSAVEIRNAAGRVLRIEAGQRVDFTADHIAATGIAERAREAWHRGVVVADNIPLQQLIEDLARYQRAHINVAPEVANLSVMGVYPANDPTRALAMLESSLPIRVRQSLSWWMTVEAR